MRFWTIWTIPAMTIAERLRRTRDWAALTIASHIPVRIKYWATVQQMVEASFVDPNKVVPEMDLEYIMRNMPQPDYIS
jgi:hypothetical protein